MEIKCGDFLVWAESQESRLEDSSQHNGYVGFHAVCVRNIQHGLIETTLGVTYPIAFFSEGVHRRVTGKGQYRNENYATKYIPPRNDFALAFFKTHLGDRFKAADWARAISFLPEQCKATLQGLEKVAYEDGLTKEDRNRQALIERLDHELKHFNKVDIGKVSKFSLSPNGGGYTWSMWRLWVNAEDRWIPTSFAYTTDSISRDAKDDVQELIRELKRKGKIEIDWTEKEVQMKKTEGLATQQEKSWLQRLFC